MTEIRENYRLNIIDLEELNRHLGRIGDRFDELEGRRGTPSFKSNVDLSGYRLTNVGSAISNTDAATYSQLPTGAEVAASEDYFTTYDWEKDYI